MSYFYVFYLLNTNSFLLFSSFFLPTFFFGSCRYFNRDVECIKVFFRKRFNFESELYPKLDTDVNREFNLDVQVAASGFTKQHQKELEKVNKYFAYRKRNNFSFQNILIFFML